MSAPASRSSTASRSDAGAARRTRSSHEDALAVLGVRKGLGAYYTPPDVVDGLLALTLDPILERMAKAGPDAIRALRVLDPACGTGNFLVAAADRIAAALVAVGEADDDARRSAVRCVRGIELDDATARRCRAELRAVHPDGGGRTVRRGDALLEDLVRPGSFDLVVGNPPFLNQLSTSTARSAEDAARLRARYGPAIGPYTDPAAIFLLAAVRAVRPEGGTVALIEPVSFLSARDAGAVRRAALADATPTQLWVAQESVFDADVEVCAPILVRGAVGGTTRLVTRRSFVIGPEAPAPDADAGSWSSLLAALQGLPDRELQVSGALGDIADATADFRDQYYGLKGSVFEQEDGREPRLVTSGLIDPGRLYWGQRSCRFDRVAFEHPRVDVERLSVPLRDWAARRLVPKVLVATQTRVLEAIVDTDGDLLPSVPVLTVTARSRRPADLWRIGVLLCSPPIAAVAARRHLGTGRNATALRLSPADLLALPLPADASAWDEAAVAFAAASRAEDPGEHLPALRASAVAMATAFGLPADPDLLAWWEDRLPRSMAPGGEGAREV